MDAKGQRHVIALYLAGERPNVRDYLLGGEDEPTVIRAAGSAKGSLSAVGLAVGSPKGLASAAGFRLAGFRGVALVHGERFQIARHLRVKRGLLAVTVVEHDELTDDAAVPFISQGSDGRSAEGAGKLL